MMTESKKRMLASYNEGLGLYKKRKFAEALACFQRALEVEPKDGPTLVYIKRCNNFIANPPGDDWDGVYTMDTK
jgi:tetratricopeptide (TPR) repeat protein